ncbi:hypothetical protein CFC21_083895, partial [Triticum aestivum]
HRP